MIDAAIIATVVVVAIGFVVLIVGVAGAFHDDTFGGWG